MPSGIASVFVVTVGIWAAVFDALVPGGTGRITMRVGIGLVMAFIGSLLLVGSNAAQILAPTCAARSRSPSPAWPGRWAPC